MGQPPHGPPSFRWHCPAPRATMVGMAPDTATTMERPAPPLPPPQTPPPPTYEGRLLETVLRNAPLVIFALDAQGRFVLSEGKALEALGLRPGEVVGRSVYDVYAAYPEVLADARRVMAGEPVA